MVRHVPILSLPAVSLSALSRLLAPLLCTLPVWPISGLDTGVEIVSRPRAWFRPCGWLSFLLSFLRLVFREPAYLQCGFTAPENHEQNFCSVICCLRAASRSKYTGRDISVEAALAACGLHKGPTLMPNNQAPASPGRACRRMCWGSASCWESWVPLGPLPPWSAFY